MRGQRLCAVLVTSLLAGCATASPGDPPPIAMEQPADAFTATVERVVDGDTLIAVRQRRRLRVRLIGIDAPESVRPGYPVECFGDRARAVLTRLLPPATEIQAAYQPGAHRDRYDRELWDVWLPDGRFVQAVLVRRGAARAVAYEPHSAYAEGLEAAEAYARAQGRGLHAAC